MYEMKAPLRHVPLMHVCSLSVENFSLKSNIKTAKVSSAVCCRGRSEHMDLKSMPTRDTFSISMYILGQTPFTYMTVHVSQGHFPLLFSYLWIILKWRIHFKCICLPIFGFEVVFIFVFLFFTSWCWRPITSQNFLLVSTAPLKTWLRWKVWWRETGSGVPPPLRRKCHGSLWTKVRVGHLQLCYTKETTFM